MRNAECTYILICSFVKWDIWGVQVYTYFNLFLHILRDKNNIFDLKRKSYPKTRQNIVMKIE